MKRVLHIVALFCTLALCTACVKEHTGLLHGNGEFVLDFGVRYALDMDVTTKSTLTEANESMVYNLYVFIFDSDENKIYGHYFDHNSLNTHTQEWWEVTNNESENNQLKTYGSVHLITTEHTGCTVAFIANIDSEMVNISPEQLGLVGNLTDLKNMQARLNQNIVSRSGYFPMSGIATGVSTVNGAPKTTVTLRRLDAKIRFTVHAGYAEDGCKIASFTPLKWQVINIPTRSYVLQRGNYVSGTRMPDIQDAASSPADFFDSEPTNFETEQSTGHFYAGSTQNPLLKHGFSFYMMENRRESLLDANSQKPQTYEDRDCCQKLNEHKSPDGKSSTVENGDFIYADPLATYVKISGRIVMDSPTDDEGSIGKTLNANVDYLIHLGDFGSDPSNFDIFRNHVYDYDITIFDVDDIRAEIRYNYKDDDTNNNTREDDPGASGNVVIAMEDVFTSDAHYSSHVITFHAKNIKAENVTWYVETPFNPDGAYPVVVQGREFTTGIDCNWVTFYVNRRDETTHKYFDEERRVFKPHTPNPYLDPNEPMNITEIVAFLKQQKNYFSSTDPEKHNLHVFDSEDDDAKIAVTAFVDEYYYEVNPVTLEPEHDLWKKFVNKPMRYMHILSDSRSSADGESLAIGAAFTIEQKSIQSIYNISNQGLHSAWGLEHYEDAFERGATKYSENNATGWDGTTDRGNTDLDNGRMNSVKEWGMITRTGNEANSCLGNGDDPRAKWSTYLDLTAANDTPLLNDEHKYLRYSCLSRNRDNNGNGVIDRDEIRWYMGATNQLIGLFLGGYGIEGAARLYQRNVVEQESTVNDVWRQHVIASSRYDGKNDNNSNTNPRVIWAEQCLTGSNPDGSKTWANNTIFSTRCVRNLGYDPVTDADITFSPLATKPDDYIKVQPMKDGAPWTGGYDENVYYDFDCTNLNEQSLRYYTNRELVRHDEHSEPACLYKRFRSAPPKDSPVFAAITINAMNDFLDTNIGDNPYCPPGYRLPNVREAAVIRNFISGKNYHVNYNFTRTIWSFGKYGDKWNPQRVGSFNNNKPIWGFGTSKDKVLVCEEGNQTTTSLRCVQDLKD
jgi:hypothetical protein